MSRMVDDATFAASQLEMLVYGDWKRRIPVKLFTDSESTLESIASLKQVEKKSLRMTVQDSKDRLIEGDVLSYGWLPTERMWVDVMTKEMCLPDSFEEVLLKNDMDLPDTEVNRVRSVDREVLMENIRNRGGSEEESCP